MRLVEQIYPEDHNNTFRTRYTKYRAGRLKHQYWLWNRKQQIKKIDQYDASILRNCQSGRTAFFASAGYYLRDIWPDIDSIEMHPVVKEFYSDAILVPDRKSLPHHVTARYDNFAVVNNRGDHWVDVDGLTDHLVNYCQILNAGARVFYSFRDTQIHYNRLKVDAVAYFLQWAQSLQQATDLRLVWHDIQFKQKHRDGNGNYDGYENPDTTNGNLKFWFVYQGTPWTVI